LELLPVAHLRCETCATYDLVVVARVMKNLHTMIIL
jgi:hypothetical protein